MENEKNVRKGVEFNGRGMLNLLAKLAIFAGYTSLVFLAAEELNFLGDSLTATDLLIFGAELGGAYLIAHSDDLLKPSV